ncbi:IS3 family transposase [Microbulbifer aggregans]|uniref:IS3 family transposase n=1 Tax=Microbulbifer aggregans TaxID=1769779 RepID=UPI001CFDD460
MKVELICAERYESIEDAKIGIFEYIEVLYNRVRRHSAIGHISPADYEHKSA